MKASIDAATARDNENAQLRAELREAKQREEDLQKRLTKMAVDFWFESWQEHRKHTEAMEQLHQSYRLLAEENAARAERKQEALKRLNDLNECLRQPDKEVEA